MSLRRAVALACVAWSLAAPARAHVGSPDTWFEGSAGPYPVRVVIRAPGVVPGLAEIDVRVLSGRAQNIAVQLYGWNVGAHGAPPADQAKRVPGDPQLWSVNLWFMEATSYGVHLTVTGQDGRGTVVIPVQAVATARLPMPLPLAATLLALALFLCVGWITLVGAAVRESSLPPGVEPDARQRRSARVAMGLAALLLALVLYGGRNWWRGVDRDYVAGLYRPPHIAAEVIDSPGSRWVRLAIDDERLVGRRWTPLIPDHGKLVHLFLVRTPDMLAMAHLHPLMRDSTHFASALPPLPPGDYAAYADIVHESGFAQTLVTSVRVPPDPPRGYAPSDADDSWSEAPAVAASAASPASCALPDGGAIAWEGGAALSSARADASLRFRVTGPGGKPAGLEPFLGMAAHAIVRSADGSVFAHLHPIGSVAMASEMALTMRAPSDSVPGTLGRRLTSAGAMDMGGMPLNGEFGIPWGFPKPGRYRMWVQVKRAGAIQTAVFDAEVGAAAPASHVTLASTPAPAAPAQGPERAATLPFIAPDGKHIVYVRDLPDKSAELVVMDADGGNPRTVAHDPAGSLLGDWTAGGREVTYVTTANDTTTLYRMALAGGTPVPMTRLSCKGLRLSNDGKRVAYSVGEWTRSRLTVAAIDGRGARAITDSSASYFNIAWSRDDKRIAVTRLDPSRALAVWVMDVDGSHARAVTSFADSEGRAQWPTWSPDGKRIAVQVGRYDRNDHTRDRSDIWVVDVATRKATNLTPRDDAWLDETPSWSPDGKTIVFQSTRSGRFEVWRMNADGSSPVQLTR